MESGDVRLALCDNTWWLAKLKRGYLFGQDTILPRQERGQAAKASQESAGGGDPFALSSSTAVCALGTERFCIGKSRFLE